MLRSLIPLAVALGLALPSHAWFDRALELDVIGRYHSTIFDAGGAEIVAHGLFKEYQALQGDTLFLARAQGSGHGGSVLATRNDQRELLFHTEVDLRHDLDTARHDGFNQRWVLRAQLGQLDGTHPVGIDQVAGHRF